MHRSTGRRAARIVALAVGVVAIAGSCGTDEEPLDAAISIASDAGEFGNGPEAGESLARIAQHVDDAIEACDAEVDGTRCASLSVASGYAQVLAVQVLQCTAPGRFEARTGMLELLRAIEVVSPDSTSTPEPPPLPDCS